MCVCVRKREREHECIAALLRGSTDFMSRDSGLCFAVDRDIAEYRAYYAKRRESVHSVAIYQVTIANSAIESLSDTELLRTYWPSAEWKNLVFVVANVRSFQRSFASSRR